MTDKGVHGEMRKFAVFSGFLGAGKTTAMIALTRYFTEKHGKAAMISNDLGHGVTLADHRLAKLSGADASEITGDCICYVNELLADRLDEYYARGCELVVSDIPGFGVGALEHVYHGLTEKWPGRFALAPFTVLTEPRTVELLRAGADVDLRYLYDTQLLEADLIVLNKCDLIDEAQRDSDLRWLGEHYPHAQRIAISARTGEGLETLAKALREGQASLRRPDIGYGGKAFRRAMKKLSESYLQYHAVVCCDDFDGSAYLMDMAERVREEIRAAGKEIPHLKLLAWEPEGDYGKIDLIGTDRPVELTRPFARRVREIAVLLNGSAACPAEKLEEIVLGAVKAVSEEYQLELTVHKSEAMGMG